MCRLCTVRERLVSTRTALINQLRGVQFDRGIVIAKGRPKLNPWLRENVLNCTILTTRMQQLVHDMVDELHVSKHSACRRRGPYIACGRADRETA